MQAMDQRSQNASAGRSDRMAKCASSAIDVDAPMVDVHVPHGYHRDRGEGLIDLVQIGVMRAPPELRERLFNRSDGGQGEPLRLLRMAGVRKHARKRLE